MKKLITIILLFVTLTGWGQTKSPEAWYKFESTNTYEDASGNGYTALPRGDVGYDPVYGGISLGGTNDYVTIPAFDKGTQVIVSLWYRASTTISTYKSLFTSADSDSIFYTRGLDTAHTENAGERIVAKLRPLVFHLYDRKIINGVPEVSWYHSNGTKEYGIKHLDPWKQVEALMGNIEMLERWLFRTQILVFILFITVGFLIKYLRKRKVKDLELRLDAIEQRLNHSMNQPLYHVKPNRK